MQFPRQIGSCSAVCSLGALSCLCRVLGYLASVHCCVRAVCSAACAASWPSRFLFPGVLARGVVLRVGCPGLLGYCSPLCGRGKFCCVCGLLAHLAPALRCACALCCVACAVSKVTWLLFSAVPACCVVLRVRCPGPLGSCSPVCPLGVLLSVCGVLGSWLLFFGVPARCVLLPMQRPGQIDSCSPVCPLSALCCVSGVLGHLASFHRCARSVHCVACAVSWATWLLFSGVPARCVLLRVQCPGLCRSCSPMCRLIVLCCACVVLGHLAPGHRCARSVCCVPCAVSWAPWLLFSGVPARCVLLPVQRPWQLDSCSPVCPLGALCCVCGVASHLAPVHRCVRAVCCAACASSWPTWLFFSGVLALCVVLRLRWPGPLGCQSPVCSRGVLCCACGVVGFLACVNRHARSVRCVALAVSWVALLLFTAVPARCVVLHVHCPGSPVFCSPLCLLRALYCVCGVKGDLAPAHRCARALCCAAWAVSWATWLLFTAVRARCVALHVRCPGSLGSCSPVCLRNALCFVSSVTCYLASVHRCARSVRSVARAVSSTTWLLFSGVPARCVVLRVQCPGQLGSCSPVCSLGELCCVCGVLSHLAFVHRCVRAVC